MTNRKEQIFAKTKNIGGVRRIVKTSTKKVTVKTVLDNEFAKGEVANTILESCSFKCGEMIHSIENTSIKSIGKGRKQNLCFVVSGNEVVDVEQDILKNMPKEFFKKKEDGEKEAEEISN
ncbi:hypothetical protein ECANGB1_1533 [Enterospora canceri]|uniref:Uncharacterized protein n=1 Tax=Enterospora canceri TaxID=1081671 RepID=A0A1Y1S5W3_9MICR|nr:hypothetical protein ECANGB1_1533 [Enterospora canceri]